MTTKTGDGSMGLLLAMMEPPTASEDEFHAWYDTEHQPGRASLPGFLNARRFVCVDGWPRYLAIYDLETLAVLKSDEYLAASYSRFSNWGKRLLSNVYGQWRGEGVQLHPGQATFGEKGPCSRLVMWRFAEPPGTCVDDILKGLASLYDGRPEVAQWRLFRSELDQKVAYFALVEARLPIDIAGRDLAAFGEAIRYLDLYNVYVPYSRPTKLYGLQK
jgi:hypothetical protein